MDENESSVKILDYTIKLLVRPISMSYVGTVFYTINKVPSNHQLVLKCDKSIQINTVRQKGVDLKYMYNVVKHTLHIACINESPSFPYAISFIGSLEHYKEGFSYIDDSTAVIQLFPNFGSLFIPCQNTFDISNISANITVEEDGQSAICSIPCSHIQPLVRNQRSFVFPKSELPFSFFSLVVGVYEKFEGTSNKGTKLIIYLDHTILSDEENQTLNDLGNNYLSLFSILLNEIEEKLNLVPHFNTIQIANISTVIASENNTTGLLLFTNSILKNHKNRKLYISKQIIKQYFPFYPKSINEFWIIEGISTFLALRLFFTPEEALEIYQNQFFIKILNSDTDKSIRALGDPIYIDINSDDDNEEIFDDIYCLKSVCFIYQLLSNKTLVEISFYLQKLINFGKILTYESFLKAFECQKYDCFVKNSGYPIILLNDDLTLKQIRFTPSKNTKNIVYSLPLNITYIKNTEKFQQTLIFQEEEIKLNQELNDSDYILINPCCESLCRVWYRGKWLGKIITNLFDIPKQTQVNIKCDMTALGDMGLVNKKKIEDLDIIHTNVNRRRFPLVRGNGSLISTFQES
ncbi:hypothetical protein TRFO_09212 [Tritrichomonas foetus]|uniref:Uncharacterized protein n=1 Tax=Tritrichomonas foetus TaxID=1144522 RepID=A0A1J4JKM2_9EUKA|nr:hypothetical protein TRFO_09212 [Tritrichomonas foetus]|eukprot:OHS97796.1 hypothetical protein TRFO_09212 [Tritrichomonas foetus]